MRRVSLNARMAQDRVATDEIEVVLVILEHPLLDEPVRLSTDNAVRFSAEPMVYGTRSTWRTPGGEPFLFVVMDALLPDETDDGDAQASLAVEILDSDLVSMLTSTAEPATCAMAAVQASSPDQVEAEFVGLQMMEATGDAGEVSLRFNIRNILDEPVPHVRMTKQRVPGLHR